MPSGYQRGRCSPPGPERGPTGGRAFLRAIRDRPDDAAPRLIYADWLEERGDPASAARAAFLQAGLMLGDLLFCRARVVVRAGVDHAVREVAEQSTLYFSHRRLHRRTEDLSAGWGSNSQWRTPFRRDYRQSGRLIYNADGKNLLTGGGTQEPDRDGLALAERVELCRHRCFVTSTRDSAEL